MSLANSNPFKDIFISYGRRESLVFVGFLHQQFRLRGIDGWFDKVNIPDGDDYSLRISNGIESAHNFIYVMAPRCMTSPYCLVELEYARVLGKRVIPVVQIPIFDCPAKELSAGDKKVMQNFYEIFGITGIEINTEKDVLDRSHALLGKTDWVHGRQELTQEEIKAIFDWQGAYENSWHLHENDEYLKSFSFPKFGKDIDPIDAVIDSIIKLIVKQESYVHKHTYILQKALSWNNNNRMGQYLLVGQERKEAEDWLLTDFIAPEQPPCVISDLHAEFLCQSRKNAENSYTDVFISYSTEQKEVKEKIRKTLARHLVTSWTNTHDIMAGIDYGEAINRGLEQADCIVFLISPNSFSSKYCIDELVCAAAMNKRVIPILVEPTDFSKYDNQLLKNLSLVQYINMTDNKSELDFAKDMSDLIFQLNQDKEYFYKHKLFLAQAIKWEKSGKKTSILPRGNNLDQAKTWLKSAQTRRDYLPTALHDDFIKSGEFLSNVTGTDVLISYSRRDDDFARKLNNALQLNGKTTWFDQESIAAGTDFASEINKGIESTNNFIFIITPTSINSIYCQDEVEHAKKFGKRFIPILLEPTDINLIPDALKERQWINFYQADFQKQFMEVLRLIDIDREHVAAHTIWQNRAFEWENSNRSPDYLLNASALTKAEDWLKKCYNDEIPNYKDGEDVPKSTKDPDPTALQLAFLGASHDAIVAATALQQEIAATLSRRLRYAKIALGIAAVLLIVAIAGFFVAFVQSNIAKEKEAEALQKGEEAEKSAKEANLSAKKAEISAKEAILSAEEASKQKHKAEEALIEVQEKEKSLKVALKEAEMAKDTARARQIEAEIAQNLADQQRVLAEKAGIEAKYAKIKTDIANKYALQQLYWFNAKEFAFKSIDYEAVDEESRKQKAILALSSFILVDGAFEDVSDRTYPIETLDALQKAFLKYDRGLRNEKDVQIVGELKSITSSNKQIAYSINQGYVYVGNLKEHPSQYPKWSELKKYSVKGFIRSLEYSPNANKLSVGTSEGIVYIIENEKTYNMSENQKLTHSSDVLSTHFVNDRILVTSSIKEAIYWNLETNKSFVMNLPINSGNIRSIASNNDYIFILSEIGRIYRFALNGYNEKTSGELFITANRFSFYSMLSIGEKALLVGTGQGELLYYEFANLPKFAILPSKHTGIIHNLTISHNKEWLASGGLDAQVGVWDLKPFYEGRTPFHRLPTYSFNNEIDIFALAFDPEAKYLLFGDSRKIQLSCVDINLLNQKLKNTLKVFPNNQLSDNLWIYFRKGDDIVKPIIDYNK